MAKKDDIVDNLPPWAEDGIPAFKTEAELKAYFAAQAKKALDEFKKDPELDKLVNEINVLIKNTSARLKKEYTLKQVYFRNVALLGGLETNKAGYYKIDNQVIKWSGKGRRPPEFPRTAAGKPISTTALAKLKITDEEGRKALKE